MDTVAKGDYVPLYSYAKNGTYRHATTSLMLATSGTANEPVAATRR